MASPEAETLESNKTTQKKDLAPPMEVDLGDLWNRSSRGQVSEDVAEPVLASESRTRMPSDTTDTLSTEIIDRNRGQAQEEAKLERSLVSEVQALSPILDEESRLGESIAQETGNYPLHAVHEQNGRSSRSSITYEQTLHPIQVEEVGIVEPLSSEVDKLEKEDGIKSSFELQKSSDTDKNVGSVEFLPPKLDKPEDVSGRFAEIQILGCSA